MKPLLRLALMLPRIEQRDYFLYLFSLKYTVVIDNTNPKLVIYDSYSKIVPNFKNKVIYVAYTGESNKIDYKKCDFSLSFDELHAKSVYLPLWVLFIDWFNSKDENLCKLTQIMLRKPLLNINRPIFCGFVAEHSVGVRNNFVKALSTYRTVTCPGKVLNNYPKIGGRMGKPKELFLRQCKFSIAFENCSKNGYITEKILHAFQTRTIPIYWGSPTVKLYFNTKAFINCHDYQNWEQVINEVIRLDNDKEAYLKMINQPVFKAGIVPVQFWPSSILKSIEKLAKM